MSTKKHKGWIGCARIHLAPDPDLAARWAVEVRLYSTVRVIRRVHTLEKAERLRDIVYAARAAIHMEKTLPSDLWEWRSSEDRDFFYEAWALLEEIEEEAKKRPSYQKQLRLREEAKIGAESRRARKA